MYNFVESAGRKTGGGANTELCLPAFNKYSLQTLFGQTAQDLKWYLSRQKGSELQNTKMKNAWAKAVQ